MEIEQKEWNCEQSRIETERWQSDKYTKYILSGSGEEQYLSSFQYTYEMT